jgi:hypothetical protein
VGCRCIPSPVFFDPVTHPQAPRTRRTSTGFLRDGAIDRDAVFWSLNLRLSTKWALSCTPHPSPTGRGEGSQPFAVPQGQPIVTNTAVLFFFPKSNPFLQFYDTPTDRQMSNTISA